MTNKNTTRRFTSDDLADAALFIQTQRDVADRYARQGLTDNERAANNRAFGAQEMIRILGRPEDYDTLQQILLNNS